MVRSSNLWRKYCSSVARYVVLMVVVNRLLSGNDFDFQCHSNLVRAVLPYGLTESDVHDVINIFQVTGLNKDGKYFMFVSSPILIWILLNEYREPSPAKPGDCK